MSINRTDTLGALMEKHPEVAPLLAQSGLHCVGCHVSAYESLEQGCKAHGMTEHEITELVKSANKMVELFDKMPRVAFSGMAAKELHKRASKEKKKFVRVVQAFGEFDFDAAGKKEKGEVELSAGKGKEVVKVLADKRIERLLRGIRIDFDKEKKDFVAVNERKTEK